MKILYQYFKLKQFKELELMIDLIEDLEITNSTILIILKNIIKKKWKLN